jgi:hypothetical protein
MWGKKTEQVERTVLQYQVRFVPGIEPSTEYVRADYTYEDGDSGIVRLDLGGVTQAIYPIRNLVSIRSVGQATEAAHT